MAQANDEGGDPTGPSGPSRPSGPSGASGPWALSALAAAQAIAAGTLTSEALVRSCLDRVAEREPASHAWVYLDPQSALAEARARDAVPAMGPLHGIPVGVKDMFDTAEMPTAYGSAIYEGHTPTRDAGVVRELRAAGAVILGKTVTTEFAYRRPGPTRNPHNTGHTPGGSSSGSAAAVAVGMVPLSLGTQTGGSVIRPASFCGISGMKPTYGFVSWDGLHPLATALDTVGWFARSVEDLALIGSVLNPGQPFDLSWGSESRERESSESVRAPRIAVCQTAETPHATAEANDAVDAAADAASRAGFAITQERLAPECDGLGEAWEQLVAVGAVSAFAAEYARDEHALSPEIRELVERGRAVTATTRAAAEALALAGRAQLGELFGRVDALLVPAAPGEAPEGLTSTGDPVFNRVWTLLRLPCVTLPATRGPRDLPVGVQLVGRHGRDRELLAIAQRLEAALAEAGMGATLPVPAT